MEYQMSGFDYIIAAFLYAVVLAVIIGAVTSAIGIGWFAFKGIRWLVRRGH